MFQPGSVPHTTLSRDFRRPECSARVTQTLVRSETEAVRDRRIIMWIVLVFDKMAIVQQNF